MGEVLSIVDAYSRMTQYDSLLSIYLFTMTLGET